MIVKNEAHIICETFNSILPYIDYWVIVDTGSTDGTQDLIRNYFKERNVSGELYEQEWVNFGHNRTEAFRFADGKSDYLWVIDADDIVHGTIPIPEVMDKDSYWLIYGNQDFNYWRPQIFRNDCKWEYLGVLHEYAYTPNAKTSEKIQGDYWVESRRLGDRNKNQVDKFRKDEEILLKALEKEPNNDRYIFYLAQTYKDGGQPDKAISLYQKRASMGGWEEEVFYSIYMSAHIKQKMGKPPIEFIGDAFSAWLTRPHRLESLYGLGNYFRLNRKWELAYRVLKLAESNNTGTMGDILFVEEAVYQWKLYDELSLAAYYSNRREEAIKLAEKILEGGHLPKNRIERIQSNLKWFKGEFLNDDTPNEEVTYLTNKLKDKFKAK